MTIFKSCLFLVVALAVLLPPVDSSAADHELDVVEVSKAIDRLLDQEFKRRRIEPNAITSDLQFLRRLSLDLIGRIPTLAEIEVFQQNPDRKKLIHDLVGSPEFSKFTSEVWTTWLIGYTDVFGTDRETFRVWLQDQIQRDRPFDKIVSQILTSEGSVAVNGPTNFLARHYEQPITAVCRSFLGVRLECAQCHDHPFDRWTQEDYESMRLFFEPLRRQVENGVVSIRDENRRRNDDHLPRFLTGSRPRTSRYRQELALYLTHCKPFARNYGNRIWYFLMGQGIVNPPDDFNQENPAVNLQLLELLAQQAKDHEFDIRSMYRVICNTHAYQRKFSNTKNDVEAVMHFAARKIKPMLPVQFIDSLMTGLDREISESQRRQFLNRLTLSNDLNEDFQRLWKYRESIQQLMQGMTIQLSDRHRITKQRINDQSSREQLEEMFLRLLTREPSRSERELCQNQSESDILFALALGNEFCFNH